VTDLHAACRAHIDDHFSGRISRNEEVELRAHLEACAPCRRGYECRRLVEVQLDPRALADSERIGRALGLVRRRPALSVAAPLVLAAACCLLLALPRSPSPFTARGGVLDRSASIQVYRADAAGGSEVAGDVIRPGDELAFSYVNGAAYPYLAVCAIDEHGHVYWYHPEWTSPDANPESIAIGGGLETHEIPAAISHDLDGATLRIVAVFSRQPIHVRDLEQTIVHTDVPLATALSRRFSDVVVSERTLRVTR